MNGFVTIVRWLSAISQKETCRTMEKKIIGILAFFVLILCGTSAYLFVNLDSERAEKEQIKKELETKSEENEKVENSEQKVRKRYEKVRKKYGKGTNRT